MKLERLVINNFRSYQDANMILSPTQNYIFGKNWQGKSSVVDAIGYALFGKRSFPMKMAGSLIKAEHIVREGATKGFVELHFEHNGKSFMLKRGCPKESVILECDGIKVGESAMTVNEYLLELLGVDKELFTNVFYAEQDALRKVLDATPEERKTFIEAILGFEYLKEVKLSAKHAADSLTKWLDGFTSGNVKTLLEVSRQLQQRVEVSSRRIDELANLISKYQDASKLKSEAETRAIDATGNVRMSLEELSAAKTSKSIFSHLLEDISTGVCPTCRQQVTGPIKTLAEHKLKHLLEEIEAKIAKSESDFKKVENELGSANSDMSKSQREETILSGYTSERNTLKHQLEQDHKQLDDLKRQLTTHENKDQVIKRINEETSFLAELQSAIDEFRNNLRRLMITDLENAANFLLAKFSDDDFDAQLKITDDFGFQILLHGHPVPVFNLSGAARDILALSIRYGLYRIASKEINFLLLDEPTHHFDQSNTAKFKQALNELADQQLVIITVHDEFSDAMGKKFIVQKDDNFRSIIREMTDSLSDVNRG